MRRLLRSLLVEIAIFALVVLGVVVVVVAWDEVSAFEAILGVGILGTLILTAGELRLTRTQGELLNRPFIGPMGIERATISGQAGVRVTVSNVGPVPGRITSVEANVNGSAQPPGPTERDFLFPEDSIHVGWPTEPHGTFAVRINYEGLDSRSTYWSTATYDVASLEIILRDGN